MSSKQLPSRMENDKVHKISLLDLPESTLDCILKYLSPIDLCRMSEVCAFLRDRCRSDHLWEKQIRHKWGGVFGDVAYKEWECHIATAKGENVLNQHTDQNGSLGSFSGVWPNLCLWSYLEDFGQLSGWLSNNFMMALYCYLESGRFWFPAQVYRGPMLTNALVNYDSKTDTFQARQQHDGWWFAGKSIQWDMVRLLAVETSPYVLHMSDCLDSLKPGDQIEIQWRGSRGVPYDWWYGVIGHLDSCHENENHCQCHYSEMLIVEFKNFYEPYMRRIVLSRKNHWENGESGAGFFGAIRKLNTEEIKRWKKLFSTQTQIAQLVRFMPPVAAQVQLL